MLLLCWKGLRNVGHGTVELLEDIERLALLARGRGISTIVIVLLFGGTTLQKIPLIRLYEVFAYLLSERQFDGTFRKEHVLHHVFGILRFFGGKISDDVIPKRCR